ncbi:MAG TPA: hypothetical protein VLA55_05815 [Ornithinibacter sp.]|nr:hypothetical protein [Ornithinibacter sp.]
MTRAVLLPSPFLPALAYAPLADALGRRGWGVVVAVTDSVPHGPEPVLTAYAGCVQEQHPDVVIAHSNAGRYAVAAAAGTPVVHVDAALPPTSGDATLAPEAVLDHLAGLADTGGLLPPWTRWWPEEDVAAVVPDPRVLAGIRAVEPRMPLSYLRARLGAPPGWRQEAQAFLALGETYADELALARRLGWPTAVLEGAGHLHHLVEPDAVAMAVAELAARLGVGSV